MGDLSRAPTADFYSFFGIAKSAYKSFLPKKQRDNKSPSKEGAPIECIHESYHKARHGNKHEEKFNNDDPSPEPGRFNRRQSIDDNNFFSRSSTSFLSRSSSRRSHTPSPKPTYLSKSASKRSTTPTRKSPTMSDLLRSFSRRGTSTAETSEIHGTPTANERSTQPETDQMPCLSRNVSRRSTTPIIFSQSQTTTRRKPPPIEQKLECTLEELCEGSIKKIKISKDVIMEGIIVKEVEVLKIKLKPGWKKGTKITFEGKGDERPGYLPADIIFLIEEKRHPLFKRRGDDLEIAAEIPLVKALTGCTLSVPLLGGDTMSITIQDIIYHGFEKAIQGQGMPMATDEGKRGDLRITFFVSFPTDLSDEQRTNACKILQDCF